MLIIVNHLFLNRLDSLQTPFGESLDTPTLIIPKSPIGPFTIPGSGDSDLTISFTELAEEVAWFIGYGRKGSVDAGLTEAQNKEVGVYVDSGYRNFLNAFDWPFLKVIISKTMWKTATGTATTQFTYDGSGNTTVTATTSVFFDTMIGRIFTFGTSGNSYTISGYSSATVITLEGNAANETASDTFTITANGSYRLPGDFGGLIGTITFQANEGYFIPLQIRSELQVRRMLQNTTSTGRPIFAAIRPLPTDGTRGQRNDLVISPIPDADYPMTFKYHVMVNKLSESFPFPYGGAAHSETIKAACIAAAELGTKEQAGARSQEFQTRLADSIRRERLAVVPESLGYNGDNSDLTFADVYQRSKVVTVGGVSYP